MNRLVENGVLELNESKDQFYFLIMIGSAIVGGLLLWWLWKVGFFIIGCLLGFSVATLILQMQFLKGILSSDAGRYIFITVFVIIFGLLILKFQDIVMIVATSIIGAYAVFLGVDYFIRTGFGAFIYNAIYRREFDGIDGSAWGMVAGFVSLAVVGITLQFKLGSSGKKI